jgi:hypothetical protein
MSSLVGLDNQHQVQELSLATWLRTKACLNDKIIDKTLARLEEKEVFEVADLTLLRSADGDMEPFLRIGITSVTASKILSALDDDSSQPHTDAEGAAQKGDADDDGRDDEEPNEEEREEEVNASDFFGLGVEQTTPKMATAVGEATATVGAAEAWLMSHRETQRAEAAALAVGMAATKAAENAVYGRRQLERESAMRAHAATIVATAKREATAVALDSERQLHAGASFQEQCPPDAELASATVSRFSSELRQATASFARLDSSDTASGRWSFAADPANRLEGTVLAEHAAVLADQLDHRNDAVREASLATLAKLEPSMLGRFSASIVTKLDDSDWAVRKAAWNTIDRFDSTTLAVHAPAIVDKMVTSDVVVRKLALDILMKLDVGDLDQHAPAVIARLKDSNEWVREKALRTLGCLGPTLLPQYTQVVIDKLRDNSACVRKAAAETLSVLEGRLLRPYASLLNAKAKDYNAEVRKAVHATLGKLSQADGDAE